MGLECNSISDRLQGFRIPHYFTSVVVYYFLFFHYFQIEFKLILYDDRTCSLGQKAHLEL